MCRPMLLFFVKKYPHIRVRLHVTEFSSDLMPVFGLAVHRPSDPPPPVFLTCSIGTHDCVSGRPASRLACLRAPTCETLSAVMRAYYT